MVYVTDIVSLQSLLIWICSTLTPLVLFFHHWGHICCTAMAESIQIKDKGPAKRPTTEKHGKEPSNVTTDKMMDNLYEYPDQRLGLRKCHNDMCKQYGIKHSENGLRDLKDIKMVYGKTLRLRANTKTDGLFVILGKQI